MKYKDFANSITSDRMTVEDVGVIQEHVIRLLQTNKGEVLDDPDYGSNLRSALYEVLNPVTVAFIQMEVKRAITTWEPRVNVLGVQVDRLDDYSLVLSLSLYVPEFDAYIDFDVMVRKG